jgi:hypothetical protein
MKEIDHCANFYEKYEVMAMFDNVISQLKLTSVYYGWRPRLLSLDKLVTEIECIYAYLSEWKELSKTTPSISIPQDHLFFANILITFYKDKHC